MVAVGLTVVEPVAEAEVNVPGAMAMEAAPEVVQLRVLVAPLAMVPGLAAKEAMVGGDAGVGWLPGDDPPHPASAPQFTARRSSKKTDRKVPFQWMRALG